MTSRFAVLEEHAGGRSRGNGVLPLRTLLAEQPDPAPEPTGYWMTNLPATAPTADLVRLAKMRWRIEHAGLPHPAALRLRSPRASLTLYQVLGV
jgi:hypothetical protein